MAASLKLLNRYRQLFLALNELGYGLLPSLLEAGDDGADQAAL